MNSIPGYIAARNVFYFQVVIGISGNTFLLIMHTCICLLNRRLKPTHLIISLLALTHIGMILSTVFMMSPYILGSQIAQDDVSCKTMVYFKTALRGLSVCTTCLLSVFQAIIISPTSSWLAKLKHLPSYYIIWVFLLFWVLTTPITGIIITYNSAIPNRTNENIFIFSKYCVLSPMKYSLSCLVFIMITLRDGFFIIIMILSSGYMVVFLYKHKRQSQYLHSTCLAPRVSPETKATQTILMLTVSYVAFNWFVFLMTLFWYVLFTSEQFHLYFQILFINSYSSVSSIILISSSKRILKVSLTLWWKSIQCKMH